MRRIALLPALLLVCQLAAAAALQHYQLAIPRQPLESALKVLSDQTGMQVATFSDRIDGAVQVGPVQGDFTLQQALDRLLADSGLTFNVVNDKIIMIVPVATPGNGAGIRTSALPAAAGRAGSGGAPLPTADSAGEDTATLAEVVVTGSNIKRTDAAVLPVTVLDNDVLQARDASTASALLNSLPQIPSAPLNETANASFGARGDFAAINLRGIGTGNTLVLLSGRRLVPHPISSTDEGGLPSSSVNVNQLPTRGVDHIEVLRDGASSIYGTDAVAGVVNYIVKPDLRGWNASLRATGNEHGDGKEVQGALAWGTQFGGGRGKFVSSLDYYARQAIFLRNRDFSANPDHTAVAPAPWNVNSAFIPLSANRFYGRQSTGAYPSFRIGSSTAASFLVPQANGSVALTTTAPVRGVNDAYFFSLNDYQAIQPSSERLNWFNQAEYEISPQLTLFGELSYYRADSGLIRQPVAYNSSNFTDQAIVVPTTSPWNPFGQPVTLLSKYLVDVGVERDEIKDSVYRVLAGLRGALPGDWTWEAAAYYNRAEVSDTAHNAVRESLFRQAIQSGAYNPFGFTFTRQGATVLVDQPYVNTPAVTSTFASDFRRDGVTSLSSVDFHASGRLLELWSGDWSAAVGAEARRETFVFSLPPYSGLNPPGSGLATDDNDFLLSGPAANWSASRNVVSAYAETVLPLASPRNAIPGLNSLELTASARYERYSDFGSTTKPKVGLSWRPFPALMVRASYNEGFRAPNLPVLNGGERKNLQSFLDPLLNVTGPHWGIFAGNPNLQPEQSTGKSVGFVLDVPGARGLSVSADYWEIAQRNLITTASITDIMLSDAALLAPIVAQNPGVPIASLNFGSGTANYRGDPRVIRNADNTVYGVRTPPFNSAHAFISGVDLNLTYKLPEFRIGRFQLRSDWAYLRSYYQYATATSLKDDRLEHDGAAKWRGNTLVSWTLQDWSAGVSAYYVGPFQDSAQVLPAATPAQQAQSEALYQSLGAPRYIAKVFNQGQVAYRYVVPSTMTYNAFIGYRVGAGQNSWLSDTTIRLGVVNLTDVAPPLDAGFTGYPTNVYTSLVPGRTWTVDVTRKF
jgi:iron complex outermembrane receptor protein